MKLYSGNTVQFIDDSIHNRISEDLSRAYFNAFGYKPSPAECRSWKNSLRAMSQIIDYSDLKDHGIILEYQLPLSSQRLDCMITGKSKEDKKYAVIVELKQWEKSHPTDGEREVLTWVSGANREVLHPSVQVSQYATYLQEGHTSFYEVNTPIDLKACSYLHNYSFVPKDPLKENKFSDYLKESPIFTEQDVNIFKKFLQSYLEKGEGLPILEVIEYGEYRPSKKLMDHVADVIHENDKFTLLDEQLVAFDRIMTAARTGFDLSRKSVVLINGGPGTGKSVIAINVMAQLLKEGYNTHYATGSRAFTQTLRRIIGNRGAVQFKYFNSYMNAEKNSVDVIVCDEAHRIREYSHSRFTPKEKRTNKKQIDEILDAGKVNVFLIDDDQVVRPGEIGSADFIRNTALERNFNLHEYELEVQFRCNGSDAFVKWIENTLHIRRTAHAIWTGNDDFDFKIFNTPLELENAIRAKSTEGYSARMTAGFCWKWSKNPKEDGTLVKDVVIDDYRRPWNARPGAVGLAKNIPPATLWAYDTDGMNQVGCVYTAQGFEFDYVGVIFGPDLVYNMDTQEWEGHKEYSHDYVVKRSKNFTSLIKNTYRVLFSRGLKGCYVHFTDKDTERFFRTRMEKAVKY